MAKPAKTLHLICNAHLDPMWIWEWQEGAAEAVKPPNGSETPPKDRPGEPPEPGTWKPPEGRPKDLPEIWPGERPGQGPQKRPNQKPKDPAGVESKTSRQRP